METIVSEISIHMPPLQKKTYRICFDEAEHMFTIALCGHEFCTECVKRHIEVRLLEGSVPRCPHYHCGSKLSFTSCANLLMPKLREMWERRIKEESVPMADRVLAQIQGARLQCRKPEMEL
ncbi:Zinc finger C3HC4 RING-type [Arabidopsis suecica]|uniref:Zinc finger C3HC4 RING-type n=1 Tax=Arabidopsis suecica TaxID=45249 RepID=A0A8T1ZV21_ARASU|nr:Zinc finger C3HC4 RING-type [Arabidopsis suecica]